MSVKPFALLLPVALAAQQAPPRERRSSEVVYDVNGRPAAGAPSTAERRRDGAVERQEQQRDFHGRPVTSRSSQERLLSERDGGRISERVIQRYDPEGRPAGRQVVRIETRQSPDGSKVTAETLYEQDLNGRLQLAERRTTTKRTTSSGSAGTTLVERPGVNGGSQVVERVERTETKRGESVVESVTSRQLLDGNNRLQERERESSVSTKAGEVTSKETRQWQVGATGGMDFVGRSSSRTVEKPDGSQVEDLEVYTTRIGGTTPELNSGGAPTLEQQVRREKKVQPDGRILETTSARLRQVAEPSRLGGLEVTEAVITPTAEGRTIERTISERDSNGRLRPVRREVEEEKK